MICVSLCRPDPTRLILTFGASVNARDRMNGNTALHWACTSGNHAVIKQLLDAGADLTLLNSNVCIHFRSCILVSQASNNLLICGENVKHACWRFGAVGSDIGWINEVTLLRARLVLGWVTVSGFSSCCGKFISV